MRPSRFIRVVAALSLTATLSQAQIVGTFNGAGSLTASGASGIGQPVQLTFTGPLIAVPTLNGIFGPIAPGTTGTIQNILVGTGAFNVPNFIQIAERAGLPATQYRVQYQLLLSRPFLLVTMVLIAATCSLRGFRFGNVQINAVLGLAAGFTFFVLSEVSRNFAMAGLTTAAAAAWVPVLIAASLALTVLLYKEDG